MSIQSIYEREAAIIFARANVDKAAYPKLFEETVDILIYNMNILGNFGFSADRFRFFDCVKQDLVDNIVKLANAGGTSLGSTDD